MVIDLSLAQLKAGHEVCVLTEGGSWVDQLRDTRVRVVVRPLPAEPAGLFATARVIAGVVRSTKSDVVHAHIAGYAFAARLGLLAARRAGPRFVFATVHGLADRRDFRRAALASRLGRFHLVGCAQGVSDDLVGAGAAPSFVITIPNGATLEAATEDRRALAKSTFGLGDYPVVMGIGRLVDPKDWPRFIRIMNQVGEQLGGQVQAVVAGAGTLAAELEELAAGGVVRFLGRVDDVAGLLANADLVVSTSKREGAPLAILEALSLGLPCVMTPAGAHPEVRKAEGVLVIEGSGPAADDLFSAEVRRLLENPDDRKALGARGRASASPFSFASMAKSYEVLYELHML